MTDLFDLDLASSIEAALQEEPNTAFAELVAIAAVGNPFIWSLLREGAAQLPFTYRVRLMKAVTDAAAT